MAVMTVCWKWPSATWTGCTICGPGTARAAACEAGLEDVDGEPLGEVPFDQQWLAWNNSTIRKLAQAIHEARMFAELPILADALEDAGCSDGRILRHLRAAWNVAPFWVLTRLLDETVTR